MLSDTFYSPYCRSMWCLQQRYLQFLPNLATKFHNNTKNGKIAMSLTKYLKTSSNGSTEDLPTSFVLCPTNTENRQKAISLSAGKNIIGRSRETGISDVRCSKRQLEFDIDLKKSFCKVRILGVNPSGINGLMAMQKNEYELQSGDVLEVIYGSHAYTLKREGANASCNAKEEEGQSTESWDSIENGKALIYTSAGVRPAEKIAAYDVDHTIIKTKSGNVFPKNIEDWQINFPEVPKKLQRLHESGFKICFFTNQGGIDKGKVDVNEFKDKVRKIVKKLGVPVQVFVAIADGYYRKPLPGMWEYLCDHKNGGVKIDFNKSFYVGDAAGRPEIGKGATKRRKDHSLADRLFAANIGVSFYTPEEHFLNHKTEEYVKPEFVPAKCFDEPNTLKLEDLKVPSDKCEMIVMVGLPGSGKSHFVHEHLAPLGYTILNADTLGSVKACIKAGERALSTGSSCVIDNTNVDIESRMKFIELAKSFDIPVRCFVMDLPLAQVRHHLAFRHLIDKTHSRINDMVFNGMKKKYTEPTEKEGFKNVVRISIAPKFKSTKDEQLYKLYLVDK